MAESIIGLLGGLAALLLWWLRRRAARRSDPLQQHRQHYDAIDREIASTAPGHPGAGRDGLADDLDELDRLSRAQDHRR
jgi:HAMP domain-containing protein